MVSISALVCFSRVVCVYTNGVRKQMSRIYTSGDGYEEVMDGDDRCYVHRLTAVAEYGYDAVVGKDVHHKEIWDGRSVPFLNAVDWLEPVDRWEHRKGHLDL